VKAILTDENNYFSLINLIQICLLSIRACLVENPAQKDLIPAYLITGGISSGWISIVAKI